MSSDRVPIQEVASPITNLANCLGTSLTVRRRLTLSESDTLKKGYENKLQDHDRNNSLGIENNRLYKGNSKNNTENSALKSLMLQKMMNSPVEKENSSKCMDMIVSKTMASPVQSSPTFLIHSRHTRGRHPLEDHDPNSQDSGFFSVPSDDSRSSNRIIESQGVIEKRSSLLEMSHSDSFICPSAVPCIDDSFIDNAVSPERLSQSSLPPGFNNLIDGDICGQKSPIIKSIVKPKNKYCSDIPRKTDSVFEDIKNTNERSVRKRKLINEFECSETSITSKKLRPNVDLSMSFESPRLDTSKISFTAPVTRRKTTLFDYGFCKENVSKLHRSVSTSEATIKAAFEKEDNGLNLIGDFSQSFILPLLSFGRHADLRSISPDTLAQLLEGIYDDYIDSYLIIDCRYPYEYEGGHIRGAINIYTKEQLLQNYIGNKLGTKSLKSDIICGKRNVLIFHCEFSSERGPSLSRYLRNADRQKNSTCYPYLDYPEMYLLDGGYCKFYTQYSRLCVPSSYRSMYDPAHTKDLRKFRSKSKTWAGHNNEGVPRIATKNTLKRLGFN